MVGKGKGIVTVGRDSFVLLGTNSDKKSFTNVGPTNFSHASKAMCL